LNDSRQKPKSRRRPRRSEEETGVVKISRKTTKHESDTNVREL
jgi:hypothetical protein